MLVFLTDVCCSYEDRLRFFLKRIQIETLRYVEQVKHIWMMILCLVGSVKLRRRDRAAEHKWRSERRRCS